MKRPLTKPSTRGAWRWVAMTGLIGLIASACVWGGRHASKANQAPERAIEASAQAFVDAFNRSDAKAIAALWTDDGVSVDEQGKTVQGRSAIEEEYAALFKQYPQARIEVDVSSIEFPALMVAIEHGFSHAFVKPGDPPMASRYRAVHVWKEGKWLIESVREFSVDAPQRADRLKDLQLMVGDWNAKGEDASIHTSIQWIEQNRFLERTYSVERNGQQNVSGTMIIGWDPQAGKIRSWSFDSTGGHGTGYWTPTPDGWRIDQAGTLADGTPVSSCDFLIRVPGEDNVLGWRSVDRRVGASILPDLREVVLDRVIEK